MPKERRHKRLHVIMFCIKFSEKENYNGTNMSVGGERGACSTQSGPSIRAATSTPAIHGEVRGIL